MLTFLRKIRRSLIEMDSARKYLLYAIGEITLVVIGILIALQINNWNEWRKDRLEERLLLVDMVQNLEGNISMFERALDNIDFRNRSTTIVFEIIENNIPYSDTLDRHLATSLFRGQLAPPIPRNGYESLKNAGLGKVSNKNLKNQIIKLFEETYRGVEEWRLYTNEFAIQDKLHWYKYFVRHEGGFRPLDMEVLRTSTEYHSLLVDVQVFRNLMSGRYEEALKETENVLHLIREELIED